MTRVIIYLEDDEIDALRRMAERDLRGLRDQARYLIVRGLAAELLDAAQPAGDTQPSQTEAAR